MGRAGERGERERSFSCARIADPLLLLIAEGGAGEILIDNERH
jgi:hypothetical protein